MMNNAFGQFNEDALKAAYDAWDFKQCKRSDGTIYGVPDTSACAQKGAREVKVGRGTDSSLIDDVIRKFDSPENRPASMQIGVQTGAKAGEGWPSHLRDAVSTINRSMDLSSFYRNMLIDAIDAPDDDASRVLLALGKREVARIKKQFSVFEGDPGSAKALRNWKKFYRKQASDFKKLERTMKQNGVTLSSPKPKPATKPRRTQQSRPMSAQEMTAALEGALGSAGVTPGLMGAMRGTSTEVGVTGWQGRNINDPRGAVTCKGGICSDKTGSWPDPNRARN